MGEASLLVVDDCGVAYVLEPTGSCSAYGLHLPLREVLGQIARTREIVHNPANYGALTEALRDIGLLDASTFTPAEEEIQRLASEAFDRGLLQVRLHTFDFRTLCEIDPRGPLEPLFECDPEGEELAPLLPQDDVYMIVVGDRPVDNTLGVFYHYSVELWSARRASIPIGENFDRPAFEQQYHGSQFIEGVELLREGGWNVYEYEDRPLEAFDGWDEEGVAVSVISYSPASTNVMPIFSGDEATVRAMWDEAIAAAKRYEFAEQDGFDGEFQHWPDSIYEIGDNANNSNTFARWLVAEIGLTMTEMTGWHPGRMQPRRNEYDYSSPPWRDTEEAPSPPPAPPR